MALGFRTITVTPSADVATDDTITFTYASGAAAQWAQADEVLIVSGLMNVLEQAADTFTLAYGATEVVLTYKDATTIPAGTPVVLQLPVATYTDLVDLTDSTTGTASLTLDDTTAGTKDDLASIALAINNLNAKVNTLMALSRDSDAVPNISRN